MSALDQQVQDAVGLVRTLASVGVRHMRPTRTDEECEVESGEAVNALLTTHRRQVLEEIEEKLRDTGELCAFPSAADFVASLRDTKEEM